MPLFSGTRARLKRAVRSGNADRNVNPDEHTRLLEDGSSRNSSQPIKPVKDPWGYTFSPLQLWVTPLAQRAKETDSFQVEDLPYLSKNAGNLRPLLSPLREEGLWAFLRQQDIGGNLVTGGVLELISGLSSLCGPIVLRQLLEHPSVAAVAALFGVSLLASLAGRAKDQVCRIQAISVASMLKAGLFEKSLELSMGGRAAFPPATVINIFSHDISFFQNYFVKVHDLWSAMLQITIIAVLVTWLLGVSAIPAFVVMIVLFASQSKANFLSKASVMGYITNNDSRVKHIRDYLYNVKAIKIQSLQDLFFRKIEDSRRKQLDSLTTYVRLMFCFFSSMNQMIPATTATTALVVYWWTGHTLTPQVIFPVLALFDLLYSPAGKLSISVTRQFSVLPSYKRITSFLLADEASTVVLQNPRAATNATEMERSTVSYPDAPKTEDDNHTLPLPFTLGPLDLDIPKGKLTMVVGSVGSGKSTLLLALAGVLTPRVPASLRRTGTVALSSQEPWIRTGSVRENIIFTRRWDEAHYRKVVRACCLEQDFASWPAGDRTVVGEKGSNVSGGQRARISLARAVYSDADILLLDDPLAAVDAHVGDKLFHQCIRALKQTVVLVTHQTTFLPESDYAIALEHGNVRESGPTDQVLQLPHGYAKSMIPKGIEGKKDKSEEKEDADADTANRDDGRTAEELHDEEERAVGSVSSSVYRLYAEQAGGKKLILAMAFALALSLTIRVLNQYWFVWWLDDYFGKPSSMYMAVYAGLTAGQALSMGKSYSSFSPCRCC